MPEIGTFPKCPELHSPTVALGCVWVRVGRNPQTCRWGHGQQDLSHGTPTVLPGSWLRVDVQPPEVTLSPVLSHCGVWRRKGMCSAAQP